MLETLKEPPAEKCYEMKQLVKTIVCSIQSCVTQRSKMWGLLLQTRTSEEFLTAWEKLMLLTLKKPTSPIFFQHVTDNIFKQLVKQKYPLPKISAPQLPPLNFEEENAVHYAAGYVIKHLGEKIEN